MDKKMFYGTGVALVTPFTENGAVDFASLAHIIDNLIANGKYTDAVDEILLKIIDAKQKKFKVIYKEA